MRGTWLKLIGFIGLLIPMSAHAAPLIVGVEDTDYLPFYGLNNGQLDGAVIAVLKAFATDSGASLEFRQLPVVRAYKEFGAGHVDFKVPEDPSWSPDDKKGLNVTYSDPIVPYVEGINVLPAHKGAGIAALKTMGTLRGFTTEGYDVQLKSGAIVLSENDSLDGLIRQVIAQRIDGAYANPAVVGYILTVQMKQPGALVFDDAMPHFSGSYLMATISHPEIIASYNAWAKTHADTIAKIKADYRL